MRFLKTAGWLLTSMVGIAMLCAGAADPNPRLVWNFTPSIPTGLYSVEERSWARGDYVALRPTGQLQQTLRSTGVLKDGRLLMKRLAATEGDEVCRLEGQVTINGKPTVHARSDQQLPSWSGCRVLNAAEVFILGEADNSFDGRYFGVTSATDIVGPLRPILTF
jgi:conjugative transfer signal peptidase TraF